MTTPNAVYGAREALVAISEGRQDDAKATLHALDRTDCTHAAWMFGQLLVHFAGTEKKAHIPDLAASLDKLVDRKIREDVEHDLGDDELGDPRSP